MTTQHEKANRFRTLHGGDPFVIPNPWDAGSARVLEDLGFRALATSSSGFAFSIGRTDGEANLDHVLAHVQALAQATDLPVSVDLEHGFGPDPRDAAIAITAVAEAGAVGGSIEDWDRDKRRLYPLEHAVERVAAAVEAARALPFPFVLTARAENHLRGNPDLDDTIRRLLAFEAVGADVVYAPLLATEEEIRTVCGSVSKPVNVLARPHLSLAQLVEWGVQRVSLGGALAWVAMRAMIDAATAIRDHGDFSALTARAPELTGRVSGRGA